MKNHAVAEHAPPFPGEQGHEIFFDPQGGGRGGQTEPCRQPRHMGVHHDADVDAKAFPKTTFAVFRATPGKATSASSSWGTSP